MPKHFLSLQALSQNSQKLLAYALLGYLNRLLVHGNFAKPGKSVCRTPELCRPITSCGRCQPLNNDAFDIFGAPPIFRAAKYLPKALGDVLLHMDEYESLPRASIEPTIMQHIQDLLAYLDAQPDNDQDVIRPIFKLFTPDQPHES